MEVNDQSLGALRDLLLSVLSPDNAVRKQSEEYLKSNEAQPGFPLLVLTLINKLVSSTVVQDVAIRQSASVLFKNMVKKRWEVGEDEDHHTEISSSDKAMIKTHVVELMCCAPMDVQNQLAEAVTLISKYDFPAHWENLLPQLVTKLASNDLSITKGVMLTANSIMKRFRYVFRSDELYKEILFCLDGFKLPLLQQYQTYGGLVVQHAQSKIELLTVFETLRLMSRVFYSLNWQDIPEFFEDNATAWMTEFAKYLSYQNPLLVDEDDVNEPGAVEKLQAAILENLNLYATKYEEVFEPFLPQFTQLVWKLLMEVGAQPKYDILATSAIKFLTSVSGKQMNMGLFTDPVLKDIIEHIVVKNLTATESDEELFEDNATDYIRKDMEGSDQDTRRRSASELVRSLLKFFSTKVTDLCVSYITAMLNHYSVSKDWRAKDAALHLVLAVAVKSSSSISGAGELNPNINILGIFESHILPEVQDVDVNARPIVKADAIKLICVFRTHLQTPFLLSILSHIIRHLHSEHVVIQTYAAMCIERFLTVKDRDTASGKAAPRITKESLAPHYQTLFAGLFAVLENPDLPENDYVMKCIMRTLVVIGSDVGPVTELVLSHLTTALERVCKNPINPHYNHYLFESVALLVRSCCIPSANSALTPESAMAFATRFESLLFPPFQAVLSQDVVEFVPYVFQILGQLLCSRPANSGWSDAYKALFPPLLSPVLWERRGNVPALTDLFTAYISRGMTEIVGGGHLTGVLGVFQKLLASKGTEIHAFKLLNSLYACNPLSTLMQYLPTIFNLLLQRMQATVKESKTARYCRLFIHSMCVFSVIYGPQPLCETLETITAGLVRMVVMNVWSHNRTACASCDDADVKQMVVGITRMLVEPSVISSQPDVWIDLFRDVWVLISKESSKHSAAVEEFLLGEEEAGIGSMEFDSSYSKLAYAAIPSVDPCAQVGPEDAHFAKSMALFLHSPAGAPFSALISQSLDASEQSALQSLLQLKGAQ
mmetsp:Transcript_30239/g.50587  ORF Transcript_30239/g.50587 Transcript_30239/m.50587 type:complete len:1000 (+) Transcript_30239:127-3126(+)